MDDAPISSSGSQAHGRAAITVSRGWWTLDYCVGRNAWLASMWLPCGIRKCLRLK